MIACVEEVAREDHLAWWLVCRAARRPAGEGRAGSGIERYEEARLDQSIERWTTIPRVVHSKRKKKELST